MTLSKGGEGFLSRSKEKTFNKKFGHFKNSDKCYLDRQTDRNCGS